MTGRATLASHIFASSSCVSCFCASAHSKALSTSSSPLSSPHTHPSHVGIDARYLAGVAALVSSGERILPGAREALRSHESQQAVSNFLNRAVEGGGCAASLSAIQVTFTV